MTVERLRTLEQAFGASQDPADLTRWLAEGLRRGIKVELWPLELAADCGSEAAAQALGTARDSSAVVCFRTLCSVLEQSAGGDRIRGHLARTLVEDLEPANPTQVKAQRTLAQELAEWTGELGDSRERQARTFGLVPKPPSDPEFRAARFARAYRRAVMVMSPNARASSWALHNLLSLIASGWTVGTPEMLEADRAKREALLEEVQIRIEAWALAAVASSLRKGTRRA